MKSLNQIRFLGLMIILSITFPIYADENSDDTLEKMRENFKKEYFSLGLVLQVVSDFQIDRSFPGNNGFNIANMRLIVLGEFDHKFGYLMRTNFINSPTILDAKLHYRFSNRFILDFGQFKSPFSHEFLIPAESIDFVNRSRAVTILAPGRQIGFQARGKPLQTLPLDFAIGIFNGNGTSANTNDNNQFLYVARIDYLWDKFLNRENTELYMGINGAYSQDSFTRISEQLNPLVFEPLFFNGERTLVGIDFRLTLGKVLISGEAIHGRYQGTFTQLLTDIVYQDIKATGFHITTGYMIGSKTQLLLRWDNFATNLKKISNWLIGGINYWPTSVTELQLNYIVNTDKSQFNYHQVLVNAQVAF